jgi:hypothetical protein
MNKADGGFMRSANWRHRFTTALRKHRALLVPILLAAMLLGGLPILSGFPQLIERLYTRGIYVLVSKILSWLAALMPISLSEIFLYLGILGALFWGLQGLWRRRFVRTFFELFAGAAALLLWFYLAWGFNYLRPRIEQQLHLAEVPSDSLTLRENFLWCIESANASWQPVPPWNLVELDKEIMQSYSGVVIDLDLPRVTGHWPPKFPLAPAILDYTMTSGIFGPFFHEVHLNAHLLPMELPFVLAHEKAHALGFARESEASFLAALVCFESADPAVRYSAYLSLLYNFVSRYRQFTDADSLEQLIRPEIVADFDSIRMRMEKYMGPVAKLTHKSYDFYLRANQVEGGMKNYSDVVDLVISWRGKK